MSRGLRNVQLVGLTVAVFFTGCSDDPDDLGGADAGVTDLAASPDADASAPDADPIVDTGSPDADAGSPPDADAAVELPADFGELFGSCIEDADCGPDGICRSAEEGYPGGYCTRTCDSFNDRTACEVRRGDFSVYHHCYDRPEVEGSDFTCEFNCLNGIDCGRAGYTCQTQVLPTGGLCIPVCGSDDECDWDTYCNRHNGLCQAEPPVDPTTLGLSLVGQPCASNDDCASGQCLDDGTPTAPTGYVNGYCVANCVLPSGFNNNDFFIGDALPQATCASETDVCIPTSADNSRQGLGRCLGGCVESEDCREGYYCLRRIAGKLFDNGICQPGTCNRTGQVDCPENYSCVFVNTTQGQTTRCAPDN